jgi:hypothetical protein
MSTGLQKCCCRPCGRKIISVVFGLIVPKPVFFVVIFLLLHLKVKPVCFLIINDASLAKKMRIANGMAVMKLMGEVSPGSK